MKPIEFNGSNVVFAKDQKQYDPLPTFRDKVQVVSCWELTEDEMAEINKTGVVWLSQLHYGQPLQPVRLDTLQPLAVMIGNLNVLESDVADCGSAVGFEEDVAKARAAQSCLCCGRNDSPICITHAIFPIYVCERCRDAGYRSGSTGGAPTPNKCLMEWKVIVGKSGLPSAFGPTLDQQRILAGQCDFMNTLTSSWDDKPYRVVTLGEVSGAASRVPSESPTEVRAAVREALATLAAEMFEHDSWGSSTVIEFRDREYPALSSESPEETT
jgi:hypothetical protein